MWIEFYPLNMTVFCICIGIMIDFPKKKKNSTGKKAQPLELVIFIMCLCAGFHFEYVCPLVGLVSLFCIILTLCWSKCSWLLFDIYYQQTLKLLKEYQRGYPDSFNIYKHSFWAIFSRWVISTLLNNIGFGLLILSGILSFSAV